ncbi:MAG: hypothetical protein B7733_25910 [Myxococcales bacterium FL481]|nr:MAG: hypothetical protein B7733_25910 [Myxococcales bacterium FL481]
MLACGETRPPSFDDIADSGGSSVGPPPSPTVIVDSAAWQMVDAAADPLAEHRPEDAYCFEDAAFLHASGMWDVFTGRCSYYMATQATLAPIRKGDCVEIPFLHGRLRSEEGGFAHVAILIGASPIWEINIPIPSEPDARPRYWMATADVPAGSPIYYHVDNHGENVYALGNIAIVDQDPGVLCAP